MYWLLEMTSARPRATCRPASVTMNGSSRKRVEMTPCMAPNAAPQATTNRTVGMRPQPAVVMIVAVSTLDRLSSAPTERSMPAVMMTKVMPTAMMPVSDTARTMLAMLSGARNRMMPVPAGREDHAADRHEHEADHALEAHGERERIEAGAAAGRGAAEARGRALSHSSVCIAPRSSPPPRARHARSPRRGIPRRCGRAAGRRSGRRGRGVRAFRSRRSARRAPWRRDRGCGRRFRPWRRRRRRASARRAGAAAARRAPPWRARLSAGCRRRARRPRSRPRGAHVERLDRLARKRALARPRHQKKGRNALEHRSDRDCARRCRAASARCRAGRR